MFTTTQLVNNRVMVAGTDIFSVSNSTVLDGKEWADIKALKTQGENHEDFDQAVRDFFAPLTDAADAFNKVSAPVLDPASYVVIQEGSEGIEGQVEVLHHLSQDSVILRLLEQDPSSERLIWVGDDLELLAAREVVQDPFISNISGILDDVTSA